MTTVRLHRLTGDSPPPPPATKVRLHRLTVGGSAVQPAATKVRLHRLTGAGGAVATLNPLPDLTREPVETITVTATLTPGSPTPDTYTWRVVSGTPVQFTGSGATMTFPAPATMSGATSVIGVRGVKAGVPGPERTFTVTTPPCLVWFQDYATKAWKPTRIVQVPRTVLWSPASPINAPIPANPTLDPNSAAIVTALSAGAKFINAGEYGTPVYTATPATPRWTIVPTHAVGGTDPDTWGPNPFAGRQIPIDMSWLTIPSADGHLVVIDGTTHYDFWKMDLSGSSPVCQWGGISDPTGDVITANPGGNATGAGFARAAGLLTQADCAKGRIDHALVFSTDIATLVPAGKTTDPAYHRFPATRSDGSNLRGVAAASTILEGARIQLDPTYDVDADTALRPYERMVAKCLQKYGAYCIDNGGAPPPAGPTGVALLAELPKTATKSTAGWVPNSAEYAGVGIVKDYAGLSNIPWGRCRVTATWNGA